MIELTTIFWVGRMLNESGSLRALKRLSGIQFRNKHDRPMPEKCHCGYFRRDKLQPMQQQQFKKIIIYLEVDLKEPLIQSSITPNWIQLK